MKSLNPYLNLFGQCQPALEFYRKCFNGEILFVQTFADSPEPVPDDYKDKIMHAEFRAEQLFFMATDGAPGMEPSIGGNISMSISLTDMHEQETIFNALAENGTVVMPLDETFWGARFGIVMDQFGVNWMLNCQMSNN